MREMIKQLVKKTPFYYALRNWFSRHKQRIEFEAWERNGRPAPSPHMLKQLVLESYAKQYGLTVLVETGTYFGDMVEGMKRNFEKIYSIELSPELFALAKKRFRGDGNVELICGDSGKEIGRLIPKLDQPALFWLDAHYSGGVTARAEIDTPIFEELGHILQSKEKRHVVIIDDARCFGTDSAYPTIEELTQFVRRQRADVEILVEQDSIRITPKG